MHVEASGGTPLPVAHVGRRFYRPELDLLRFFAFLMVYWSHALPLRGTSTRALQALKQTGALGVPLFFMLSAYLITELLLREKASSGSVNIRAFYIRRVLRIWPLYFLALFCGFAVSQYMPVAHMSVDALLAYLLLTGNWYTVLHGYLPWGFGTLWSIGIEEQFYLLWPSLARFASRKALWATALSVWALCQIVLLALCHRHVAISPVLWANSFSHFQYFALGIMLSLWLHGRTPPFSPPARTLMALVGLGILFAANFAFNTYLVEDRASMLKTYPGYLITGVGVALLLLSFLGSAPSRVFSPGVSLGKISYGLYVYHLPVLLLMLFLNARLHHALKHPTVLVVGAGFPLTVLIAWLSYRFLETPFLKLKERFAVVQSRSV